MLIQLCNPDTRKLHSSIARVLMKDAKRITKEREESCRGNKIIKGTKIDLIEICNFLSLEMDDTPTPTTMSSTTIQRLNSYASSSSSSGVATNLPSKSLSQNLSCDSSRSNFSTFESLDLNLSDCSDLASSLPSCASGNVIDAENRDDCKLKPVKSC